MRESTLVQMAVETVATTQRRLPVQIRPLAKSVPVHYEAAPGEDLLEEGFEPDILGMFLGDPHGTSESQDNPSPPQIILYVENIWDYAEEDVEIFREEVRLTYLHELGHYLGWDEEQVAQRGLD